MVIRETYTTGLGKVLKDQGRRMAWVADQLGVDTSTVWRWVHSERGIPEYRVRELALLLGVEREAIRGTD